MVRASVADFAVIPKVEGPEIVRNVAAKTGKPCIAMIETARGVLSAPAIADASAALLAGTNDLGADLGIALDRGRSGLTLALQSIVLAARAANVAVFDGVYNGLSDDEQLATECIEGKAFGFDGKSLIHPSHIATCNRLFSPTAEEVEVSERLIAAAGGGAERFEGRMIEDMHVAQAREVLAKAHH